LGSPIEKPMKTLRVLANQSMRWFASKPEDQSGHLGKTFKEGRADVR